jgi:hypothetical protein
MKSLTTAEGKVIATLLAAIGGNESTQVRASGVPRSTYQAIRRRAFMSGWLYERFVPTPEAVGAAGISIEVAQPFAERWADLVREWRRHPDTVVLQASPESLLRVSYYRDQAGEPSDSRKAGYEASRRRSWAVCSSAPNSSIPIYFDFEAAWSTQIGKSATVSYPLGLPKSPSSSELPAWTDIAKLIARPFMVDQSGASIIHASRAYLGRRERKILELGWVAHRVFPSLSDVPPSRGGRAEQFVFLTGGLLPGKALTELLGRLAAAKRITPFLAASGSGRVILGMLAPNPAGGPGAGPSTVALMEEYLEEIEIVRESIDSFLPVVDHRYDRLINRP